MLQAFDQRDVVAQGWPCAVSSPGRRQFISRMSIGSMSRRCARSSMACSMQAVTSVLPKPRNAPVYPLFVYATWVSTWHAS